MASRNALNVEALLEAAETPQSGPSIDQPDPFDVLLGKGQGHVTNPGNRRFHDCINMHKDKYNQLSTKKSEKTKITAAIVDFVKHGGEPSERGRFLKRDPIRGCWYEVSDDTARLKASQALRYTRRSPSGASTMASARHPSLESQSSQTACKTKFSALLGTLDAFTSAELARNSGQVPSEPFNEIEESELSASLLEDAVPFDSAVSEDLLSILSSVQSNSDP